jgi:hypothetical protein
MARGRFLLAKEAGRQERATSAAVDTASKRAGKRAKWTTWGGMIGSLGLPMLASAALGPVGWAGAAMLAGAGSLAGSQIGKTAVGKKGWETKGLTALDEGEGKFFKETRKERKGEIESLYGQLGKKQVTSAVGSAILAGATVGGKELASGIKAKVGGVMKGTSATTDVFSKGKMFGNLTAGGRAQLHGSSEIFGGAMGKAQMKGVQMHTVEDGQSFDKIAGEIEGLTGAEKLARVKDLKKINPLVTPRNMKIGSQVRLNKWAPAGSTNMGKFVGGSLMAAGAATGSYGMGRYLSSRWNPGNKARGGG